MKFSLSKDSRGLLAFATAAALIHIVTNYGYGFHRDELDIIMNARHLDWGYVAYPPITPWIARLGLILFGPSQMGLRLFSAIAQGLVVLLAGLIARDMGGGRRAQLTAAAVAYASPMAMVTATMIQYMAFDFLAWVLIAYCFVRRLSTGDPRWWLAVGAAIGLGLMTKYTVGYWIIGLAAGALFTPLRRDLRSPWLWGGAALALLIWSPNLVWQVQHNFISLRFLAAIHARDIEWGRTDNFLLMQFYEEVIPFLIPLWVAGLYYTLVKDNGRWRVLGIAYLVTLALFAVSRGRSYYTAPTYVPLLAAGSVWLEAWLPTARPRKASVAWNWVKWTAIITGVLGLAVVKPIAPPGTAWFDVAAEVNGISAEMVGWPELVRQVADIYHALPAEQQAYTGIVSGNYGEAGALELYGPGLGLQSGPPYQISGANNLWYRGYGNPPPQQVLLVGFDREYAIHLFGQCSPKGIVTNPWGVENEETTNHISIYLCSKVNRPWSEIWQEMQWFQ